MFADLDCRQQHTGSQSFAGPSLTLMGAGAGLGSPATWTYTVINAHLLAKRACMYAK